MKIMLNTELVRATVEGGKINLYIRMTNGQWAMQRPYDADLRGQISALTLALDALAGKIILTETVQLDERDFAEPKAPTIEVSRLIEAPKATLFKAKV
jgi:hypothetical protein